MTFSVEIDKYNPMALAYCLKRLSNVIDDFEYDWHLYINAGGIDYGIYMNIDPEKKEIEISNGSTYGGCGDDCLDDVFDYFAEMEEEEE